jgi:hypothetical protein
MWSTPIPDPHPPRALPYLHAQKGSIAAAYPTPPRGTPRRTPRPHPLSHRHGYKRGRSPPCPLLFHHFLRALFVVKHPNALPFASCPSTIAEGTPPHQILVEALPPRPSSVSTTASSSLFTFAMSHPSLQPSRAAGPFHLHLQPPR